MRSTLIFDGDCGLCTSSARWAERHLGGSIEIVASQHVDDETLGAHHITRAEVESAVYFVDSTGEAHRGHAAIAAALRTGGRLDRVVGRLMIVPPISWVAQLVYRVVVRYRYRLPGGTPACKL